MAQENEAASNTGVTYTTLPFPPLKKSHILNCSYHSWHPKYRSITPKARLIPLSTPFINYLRADGIVLPENETNAHAQWSDSDSGIFSSAENDEQEDAEPQDVAAEWREIHESIKSTIQELGGKVVPKLNWSAPKDAVWISATNSMECRTPDDIYLLLKSSDFVTHDLEHAFDDTIDEEQSQPGPESIPFHLVLRKFILLNPSVEFRCFVRNRKLIAVCQRDLNHFEFLFKMEDQLRDKIQDFFEDKLRDTFPDENFVFDVYIPPPHSRVWLIDVNPWAVRTDPLLFSWLELLTMEDEVDEEPSDEDEDDDEESDKEEVEELAKLPVFRLIRRDDPEAYGFSTQQYSAHKLPKDVVDASRGGEGQLREFADQWKDLMERSKTQQAEDSEDE